jgi:hypothetical protein
MEKCHQFLIKSTLFPYNYFDPTFPKHKALPSKPPLQVTLNKRFDHNGPLCALPPASANFTALCVSSAA